MTTDSPDRPLREVLAAAARQLAAAGVPSPRHDAEVLAGLVLGAGRAGLLPAADPTSEQAARFEALVGRRAAREPLQHLTGRAPFRHLELLVGPGVFVPRPETEVVAGAAVDEAARQAALGRPAVVVDLCTGSGAIALAVAMEVPAARVAAVELDPVAHAWAVRNVAAHRMGERVDALLADIAEVGPPAGVLARLAGTADVVVANPPYVPDGDCSAMDPEVREHDPPRALFAGPDGLAVVRTVVAVAAVLLRPGGLLVCEHDSRTAGQVRALAASGWADVATGNDLAGRPRYLSARRAGPE